MIGPNLDLDIRILPNQLTLSKVDEHIGSVLFLHLPPDHMLRKVTDRLPKLGARVGHLARVGQKGFRLPGVNLKEAHIQIRGVDEAIQRPIGPSRAGHCPSAHQDIG